MNVRGRSLRRRALRKIARTADRWAGTSAPQKKKPSAPAPAQAPAKASSSAPAAKPTVNEKAVTRLKGSYRQMTEVVLGLEPGALPEEEVRAKREYVHAAKRMAADAELARLLRSGVPLTDAVVNLIRGRFTRKLNSEVLVGARALCHSLHDQPETRQAGALGGALVARHAGTYDLAWDLFSEVPRDVVARNTPVEFLRTAAQVGDLSVVDECVKWIDQGLVHGAKDLFAMASIFFAVKEHSAASRAIDAAREAGDADERLARRIELLADFTARAITPQTATVPQGHVSFGVIDYKQPDEGTTSSNVGDYVQTIASLGHLVRHANLRLHGDDELVEVVSELQGRVRPELAIDGPGADVQLMALNRDSSSYDAVPENTWAIAFGWYMQDIFGLAYDFPFNPNVNPLFISFHVNRPNMLTPEAIEYLKAHGPIGCRDWNTVYLLLARGVPAFFSGCLTTTISTVFPDAATPVPVGGPTAYVDTPAPTDDAIQITQMHEDVRWTSMGPNVREALGLLESYRSEFGQVVTSRLHCYLPSWSIGANVQFTPKNRADVRFAGLLDADENDLNAMRERIRRLLAPAMALVLQGASREEVYAEWRKTVAPEVALAEERFAAPTTKLTASFDVDEACRTARASRVLTPATAPRTGEVVNVAVALDGNLKQEMEIVIGGMVQHSDRPLHVVALTRDHTTEDHDRLAGLFPEVSFEWIACDDIDYGPVLGMLKHITVSTMDRLLLPELLPNLDRVVYHDIDALTVKDIATLHDVDLGGSPLAARPSVGHGVRSGLGNILKQGRRLSEEPVVANEFFRAMYQRHPNDFDGFNAGILLMDLAQMRSEGFTADYVAYVETYGLNDQEILNCYAGSRYRKIEPAWNNWPTQETVTDPSIVHWAGWLKPWNQDLYVKSRDLWDRGAAFVASRRTSA
ncbi:lipopolysaccharide biosynthesis glycosyltransferase [Promicromonospora sp. AC04]|uniref:glycosyltransferase family 8 protein n=1 Tax=Promicromonospora sp. AC04 TaxID=2135723 RepID=UPI000D399CA6|nr:glycosyltransferase [Promicromonospora sp. AC04]PUB32345.1 lipopolysaccharide biosynthesis glycosyltransferase [Promicromonospora sp. AC04]